MQDAILQTVSQQAGRRTAQPTLAGPRGTRKVVRRPATSGGTRGKVPSAMARQASADTDRETKPRAAASAWSEVRRVPIQAHQALKPDRSRCFFH